MCDGGVAVEVAVVVVVGVKRLGDIEGDAEVSMVAIWHVVFNYCWCMWFVIADIEEVSKHVKML